MLYYNKVVLNLLFIGEIGLKGGVFMQTTVNKKDLEQLGFKPSVASRIIRESKCLMVQKGFSFYDNSKLGLVPRKAVEEILGFHLDIKQQLA